MNTKRTKKSLLSELDELREIRTDLQIERNGLKIRVELLEKENETLHDRTLSYEKQCTKLLHEKDLLSVQFQKAKNLAHALVEEGTRLVCLSKKKDGQ